MTLTDALQLFFTLAGRYGGARAPKVTELEEKRVSFWPKIPNFHQNPGLRPGWWG